MEQLLQRAALDILRLEARVAELEDRCKVPEGDRFSVRDKWFEGSRLASETAGVVNINKVIREARRLSNAA